MQYNQQNPDDDIIQLSFVCTLHMFWFLGHKLTSKGTITVY